MAAIQALPAGHSAEPSGRAAPSHAGRPLPQFVRFLVVGVSNSFIDLGLLNVLVALAPPHDQVLFAAENSVAVACALINSYIWNARWTFLGQATGEPRQRVLFFAQAVANLLLNNVVLLAVMALLPAGQGLWLGLAINVAKLCAMLVASSMSFFLLRVVVFRAR